MLRTLRQIRGHPTADEVWEAIRANGEHCTRATVYNTLARFTDRGLTKALPVAPGRTHYDTVTAPHPHLYNVDTGEIRDLPARSVPPMALPSLPAGTRLEEVSVVVRVRGPALAAATDEASVHGPP